MPFEHNYQRVYWAGAAIALMIDVELRERSHGELTVGEMLALGVSVSLGADGAPCNNRLDMFTEMRTAAL